MGVKKILTIAGSDSGGGAGIQADLKTITLLGGYALSVVTAVTAQSTVAVEGIYPVSADFVERQLETVFRDIGANAVKTGMLYSLDIVEVVAESIRKYKVSKLVVDPVIVSESGHRLLSENGEKSLLEYLIPLATVVTPNIPEAESLLSRRIGSVPQMREAAKEIYNLGCGSVLIKGGHLEGQTLTDVFYDGAKYYEFESKRAFLNTHGTGCTYSAAIATYLANGFDTVGAVKKSKQLLELALSFSVPVGKGRVPTNPYRVVARDWERYNVIESLKRAVELLKKTLGVARLFPEVQSNLGYSIPRPKSIEDVAAFPGRFVRIGEDFFTVKDPSFGVSRHIANIILTANHFKAEMRAAMNIRYDELILRKCLELGFTIAKFDRREEPLEIKEEEGSTLVWGVANAIKQANTFPDIIFDVGEIGKEAMIRVLGKDPEEVVSKIIKIAKGSTQRTVFSEQ